MAYNGKFIKGALLATGAVAGIAAISVGGAAQQPAPTRQSGGNLEALCNPAAMQAIASTVTASKLTVKESGNAPFKGATRYVAADGKLPAYCQVTGTMETNPKTGKTAGFLATFPANWNGKFMQSGCSGHCGQFYVNNPGLPPVTVTAQGWPGQIIELGYAHFATDQGHEGLDPGQWAIRKDGSVDQDFVDDFYFRANLTLAKMGKQFTTALYGKAKGAPQTIKRSYFNGCSGGGRDAFVAASYFPEQYDGIIGGSAYDMYGQALGGTGFTVLTSQLKAAGRMSPAVLANVDKIVKAQCDKVDGVEDGVIQNPAACNFVAQRDLPKCADDKPGDQCFTKAQVDAVHASLTGVTDDKGYVIQPGVSVSEFQGGYGAGVGLGVAVQNIFTAKNDPKFNAATHFKVVQTAGSGIQGPRAVVESSYADYIKKAAAPGSGHLPENRARLMNSKTKFLIWHNWSDEALTPYNSTNWYRRLAKDFGGYAKVQNKVRLFMLPGTAHCSIIGNEANSFDAIGAMDNWVEKGVAPDSLVANVLHRQFSPGAPQSVAMRLRPNATQLLCKFPEMARYSGKGDVKDAKNWSCPSNDRRLLINGETGRQVGSIEG